MDGYCENHPGEAAAKAAWLKGLKQPYNVLSCWPNLLVRVREYGTENRPLTRGEPENRALTIGSKCRRCICRASGPVGLGAPSKTEDEYFLLRASIAGSEACMHA